MSVMAVKLRRCASTDWLCNYYDTGDGHVHYINIRYIFGLGRGAGFAVKRFPLVLIAATTAMNIND